MKKALQIFALFVGAVYFLSMFVLLYIGIWTHWLDGYGEKLLQTYFISWLVVFALCGPWTWEGGFFD